MEELFGSQHKNKNMQMRHTRCAAIINYFDNQILIVPNLSSVRWWVKAYNAYVTWSEHTVKCTIHKVLTTQLNHLASLTKRLNVHLKTKWLLIEIPLQSFYLFFCYKYFFFFFASMVCFSIKFKCLIIFLHERSFLTDASIFA